MRKKKLVPKKKSFILLGIILVAIFFYPVMNLIQITSKGYDTSSVGKIMSLGIKNDILKNDYNKTMQVAVKSKEFNKKNIELYFKTIYYDDEKFISRINGLFKLGYSIDEINIINKNNSSTVINEILTKEYNKKLVKYMDYNFYKDTNLYRYVAAYDGDYKETIVGVNIGLDTEYYSNKETITKYSVTLLANKYHMLDETYIPDNLISIKSNCANGAQSLAREAAIAFENMCNDMQKAGMNIQANSSYRSYFDQQSIYDTYLDLYGQSYVDKNVALPGYSEHQTGLSVDVMQVGYNAYTSSPANTWLLENSSKYGFILRYPSGKEELTGYKNEPWHYRYVGQSIAEQLVKEGLTYEEYYVMYLDK